MHEKPCLIPILMLCKVPSWNGWWPCRDELLIEFNMISNVLIRAAELSSLTIGIKHGFSCINIRQVPRDGLKTETEGRGFQHLPRDLANVNALKKHVRSLLLHKNWKHLLNFALFLALFCCAFSPMSRERYSHGLCSFWDLSWRQQICGPGTIILKVA